MRDLLVAGADVNATLAPQGVYASFTVLMIASCFGRVKCVRELLKFKADVEAKSGDGRTALMYVADYGHAGIIREFLEGGGANVKHERLQRRYRSDDCKLAGCEF